MRENTFSFSLPIFDGHGEHNTKHMHMHVDKMERKGKEKISTRRQRERIMFGEQ